MIVINKNLSLKQIHLEASFCTIYRRSQVSQNALHNFGVSSTTKKAGLLCIQKQNAADADANVPVNFGGNTPDFTSNQLLLQMRLIYLATKLDILEYEDTAKYLIQNCLSQDLMTHLLSM